MPAAMRSRTLAELEPAGCFDLQGKGSDREGPNCYCQSARINCRRRANPATKAPIRNRVHAMARRMRGENAPGKARETS
jgi:hypothetical protein